MHLRAQAEQERAEGGKKQALQLTSQQVWGELQSSPHPYDQYQMMIRQMMASQYQGTSLVQYQDGFTPYSDGEYDPYSD